MLEKMRDFFEARLDGYDEHMMTNIESAATFYPFTAKMLPAIANCHILDLGCGTGLELEAYYLLCPSAKVTAVRTGHGTTDWFQIGKGVRQGCILSPCLFNLYAEYIMRNAGLEETQAGIKIARRNINNLRYADDTILMAESEEELKSLLMKVMVSATIPPTICTWS